jgi:hypothetical protein
LFTVTNDAAARLARRLSKEGGQERTFRFVREDHGWRLRLGHVMDGDTIIQHRSKAVLVMDSAVAGGLADRTLDVKSTVKGPRLSLHRHSK